MLVQVLVLPASDRLSLQTRPSASPDKPVLLPRRSHKCALYRQAWTCTWRYPVTKCRTRLPSSNLSHPHGALYSWRAYAPDDADFGDPPWYGTHVVLWEEFLEETIANGWTAPQTASTFWANEPDIPGRLTLDPTEKEQPPSGPRSRRCGSNSHAF
jgi:hypothetical protein